MTSYTKYEVMKLCKICDVMQNMNSYTKNEVIQKMKLYKI